VRKLPKKQGKVEKKLWNFDTLISPSSITTNNNNDNNAELLCEIIPANKSATVVKASPHNSGITGIISHCKESVVRLERVLKVTFWCN
jgi:hypothetical protein